LASPSRLPPPAFPTRRSSDLDSARAAGLQVRQDLDLDPEALSTPVDAAAYRVIQEAVTNILRHAEATAVRVTVRLDADQLQLEVADDGRGAPADSLPGHGIIGMSERVRLLGGELTTRSGASGFTVAARMPARLDPCAMIPSAPRSASCWSTSRS